MYRFFLRSCKLMGVFIIHPCLPYCSNLCKQQGLFAPRTLLRFSATVDPSDSLSSSTDSGELATNRADKPVAPTVTSASYPQPKDHLVSRIWHRGIKNCDRRHRLSI